MPLGKQSLPVIASVAALGLSVHTGARERLDSGVKGKVLYGPTCPVQRAGESCVRPYRAKLRVLKQATRGVVATTRSDAGGRFTVRIAPGRYVIQPISAHLYPRASSQRVRVRAHRFTRVTIFFDS